jgi:hypothetical protein
LGIDYIFVELRGEPMVPFSWLLKGQVVAHTNGVRLKDLRTV